MLYRNIAPPRILVREVSPTDIVQAMIWHFVTHRSVIVIHKISEIFVRKTTNLDFIRLSLPRSSKRKILRLKIPFPMSHVSLTDSDDRKTYYRYRSMYIMDYQQCHANFPSRDLLSAYAYDLNSTSDCEVSQIN